MLRVAKSGNLLYERNNDTHTSAMDKLNTRYWYGFWKIYLSKKKYNTVTIVNKREKGLKLTIETIPTITDPIMASGIIIKFSQILII